MLTCNPKSHLGSHQFVNGSCFALPALGQNGPYIMPYMHGPAYFNSDLSLEKAFVLPHERKIRFRYAAFNFLNHPLHSFGTNASQGSLVMNGTSVSNAVSTGTAFGYAPQTVGRRLSELSLKFEF